MKDENEEVHKEQMTMLGDFFEYLYPEVPWFEKYSTKGPPPPAV